MIDYPLKFTPILKEKIWGGNKLKELLHKDSEKENIGESWEISGIKSDVSVVKNGSLKGQSVNQLLSNFKEDFLGKKLFQIFGTEFPLLIKFIDAKTDLSVQVHPNDEIAKERHSSFGKTEMWYILEADKGAEIQVGFKKGIGKSQYLEAIEKGKITEVLNFEKVRKGDSFFINTGLVHAIGGGVLLAEIQQTSDITYRIYDWDRTDASGNRRELHNDLAIDALDFERTNDSRLNYAKVENESSEIASCRYFTTNYLSVTTKIQKDYSRLDSFVIYMCVSGNAEIEVNGNSESIVQGQTILIPALNKQVSISSQNCELLEVYIS